MRRNGPHKAYGLYAHITWHTWRRQRSVRHMDVSTIAHAVQSAAERHKIHVLAQAVLADHVHVVVSYRPDTALAFFVRDAKSESARRVNSIRGTALRWCRGYYAGSLSRSHLGPARVYLARQHARHPDLVPARVG